MTRDWLRPRYWVPALVVLAGAAVALVVLGTRSTPAGESYGTAPITRGDLVAQVSATGTLGPVVSVEVGSQVSGTIEKLNVDFNSRVKKGQVIAQIEPSLFRAQLAQAQANLKSAESARDKAWVGVLEAERQQQRMESLAPKNLVSESQVDAARFARQSAVAEHKLREAAIAQARASVNQARVNLAHSTIYAPIDGVVISRDVDVGQTVAASLQAPKLFTIAQDLTQMQIETDVDEAFIGMIQLGQPVKFTVFAYPNRNFDGRVVQVRLKPKVEAGVVKYNSVLRVDNPDLALKPGMTATVTIEVARHENVLKVPNAALRFVPGNRPLEEIKSLRTSLKRGEAILWAVNGERLEPVTVRPGLAGEKETEVSGDGVKEGLRVAVPETRKDTGNRPRGIRMF